MSGLHHSKFAKARKRKPPKASPATVMTPAERAAFLASRPDLRGPK